MIEKTRPVRPLAKDAMVREAQIESRLVRANTRYEAVSPRHQTNLLPPPRRMFSWDCPPQEGTNAHSGDGGEPLVPDCSGNSLAL
ncbi:hypothetical protein GCM10009550_71650 [Actinocorallia libanotica]|uniref:Uncharacterized protein n=1 Tax=Actinocorallia libanotica TaxID=46162 RepID=A0ABP4CF99_9ACTN